jgi:hypothetical protein
VSNSSKGSRRWLAWAPWLVGGLVICLLSLGCAPSMKIAADWDPDVDFAPLGSWAYNETPMKPQGLPSLDDDTLLANRVKSAIEGQMASKGYRQTDRAQADFLVTFFLVVEDKVKVSTINNHYGYGPGWGYGYYGGGAYGSSTTTVDQYKQGTLVVDISRGDENSLIWRGSASTRLSKKTTPEKSQARANEAVMGILRRFPPPKEGDGAK